MSSRFIHLHLHTEFSLADSTIRVPEKPDEARPEKAKRPNLLSRAVEMKLPAQKNNTPYHHETLHRIARRR